MKSQMYSPTARQHCGFLIEVHDVDLTEMAADTTDGVSASYVPQEDRPISSGRREFGIIVRTARGTGARVSIVTAGRKIEPETYTAIDSTS